MHPLRSCIICRKKKIKSDLYRIVNENNHLILDRMQKINARGIYMCKDINCINKCEKMLERKKISFKIEVTTEELLNILNCLKNELGE